VCSNGYVKNIPTIAGSLIVVSLAVYLMKESWISFGNMEETIGAMNFEFMNSFTCNDSCSGPSTGVIFKLCLNI
jgi:hypothetical protein